MVEFGLILSVAQTFEEGLEALLFFFQPAQRVGFVSVEGAVTRRT